MVLVGLLRAAGIPAHVALVSVGSRQDVGSASMSDVKEQLLEYAKENYVAKSVSAIACSESHDLLRPFKVELKAHESELGHTDLLSAALGVTDGAVFSWLPQVLADTEAEKPRKAPLALSEPYEAEVLWTVEPPRGFVVDKLPEPTSVVLGPSKLTREVSVSKRGAVDVRIKFSSGKADFSASEAQHFVKALAKHRQSESPLVEFVHEAKRMADAGRHAEAVNLLQSTIGASPKDALPRMRLAHLLAPLVSHAARDTARGAVALAPTRPAAI